MRQPHRPIIMTTLADLYSKEEEASMREDKSSTSVNNEDHGYAEPHEIDAESDHEEEDLIDLTITHHGKPVVLSLAPTATMQDLASTIASELSIPLSNQKYMITPKVGTLKSPFSPEPSISTLRGKKIVLLGTSTLELSSLQNKISQLSQPRRPSPIKAATPAKTRDWRKAQKESQFTFHMIRPLPYLPHPEKSTRFLERLRDDPGIKAAMAKHQFSVGLLTEMDPAMHTTHESKTLGLNRNKGEVIELRLRTDAYDGYRDYKTIRTTLCHELAHNVFGPHDRQFFDLMAEIEKEVKAADWTRGGRSVGEVEFYNPNDGGVSEDHFDGGGWTGGEFVLGASGGGAGTTAGGGVAEGLSRREILARAAEARVQHVKEARDNVTKREETGK